MKKSSIYITLSLVGTFMVTAIVSAQSINLRLSINNEESDTIFSDEPVFFDLVLTNQKAQADARWNASAERGLKELREKLDKGLITQAEFTQREEAIKNSVRKLNVVTIGSVGEPWTNSIRWVITNTANRNQPSWPITLMKNPSPGGEAKLDENGYFSASFGIDPAEWQRIPPGTYAVEISINNFYSNAVVLTTRSESLPTVISNSIPVLYRWGQYYWQYGDAEKTIQYADRILTVDPLSIDGHSLKGDGLILQRSYLPALESFNKARAEYVRRFGTEAEPPEYLLSKISWLKHELGDPMR